MRQVGSCNLPMDTENFGQNSDRQQRFSDSVSCGCSNFSICPKIGFSAPNFAFLDKNFRQEDISTAKKSRQIIAPYCLATTLLMHGHLSPDDSFASSLSIRDRLVLLGSMFTALCSCIIRRRSSCCISEFICKNNNSCNISRRLQYVLSRFRFLSVHQRRSQSKM